MTEAAQSAADPQSAGARLAARWREGVLLVVFALVAPVAYLSHLAVAVLVALAGLLLLPELSRSRRPLLGLGYLLLLGVWALVSMSWSLFQQATDPAQLSIEDITALKMLLELGLYGAFMAAALRLSPPSAQRIGLVLTAVVVLLAALLLVEGLLGAQLYAWLRTQVGQPVDAAIAGRDVKRLGYFVAVLVWPAALWLAGRGLWWAGVMVGAAMVAGAALLGGEAPAAALLASVPVFLLVLKLGRPAVVACLVGVCAYLLLTPLLVQAFLPPAAEAGALAADPETVSWAIRLDIWRFAANRALEKPLLGWGLDASRMFPPVIQLHPHNAALQLWLELGVVGAGLAAMFWAWLFGRIDRAEEADRPMAAASAAAASVYLVIGALSFGVWQEWWIALGVLTAAACVAGFIARQKPALAPEGGEPVA